MVSIPSLLLAQATKQFEGDSTKFHHEIPKNPNKVDSRGRKTGKWTILYDGDWMVTKNPNEVAYYRLISYREDKPVGKMGDYYSSGQIQMSATLISDDPETYNGEVILYSEEGNITSLRYYQNGHFDYNETILRLEKIVKDQRKKGKNEMGYANLFVRSAFQNETTFNDDLRLTEKIDRQLTELSNSEGTEQEFMFIDANNFSVAYSLKGRYSKTPSGYLVKVRLFKGDQLVNQFEVLGNPDDLAEMIVSKTLNELN